MLIINMAKAKVTEAGLNSFPLVPADHMKDSEFKGKWVGIGYKFNKITKVNDGENSFDVDFFYYPIWKDETLVGKEKGTKVTLDELKWEPKIKFKNELTFAVTSESYWISDPSTGTIEGSVRIIGTFFEHLEMEHFPLDVQDLRIWLDSFYHHGNLRFYQREDRANIFAGTRFPLSEWSFEDHSGELRTSTVASGFTYYTFVIKCLIRRRHEYYVQNTFFTSLMILVMAAGTFNFSNTDVASRLNFLVTLALTIVAFKYLMTQQLPKVPYSTYMDIFLYLVFALLSAMAVDSMIIGRLSDPNAATSLNDISFYIYIGLVVILFVVAGVVVLRRKSLQNLNK